MSWVKMAGRPTSVLAQGIVSIGGRARMTGLNAISIDNRDPFGHGFVVTWMSYGKES